MKSTNELTTLFWSKEGELAGLLYENGHREIYKVSRATKGDVQKILETQLPE